MTPRCPDLQRQRAGASCRAEVHPGVSLHGEQRHLLCLPVTLGSPFDPDGAVLLAHPGMGFFHLLLSPMCLTIINLISCYRASEIMALPV